nr:unnamed protein product [Callosobruchus chinensis]
MATEEPLADVCDWKVLDLESLSCHRFIQFRINNSFQNISGEPGVRDWNLRRLDISKFKSGLSARVQESSITSLSLKHCLRHVTLPC